MKLKLKYYFWNLVVSFLLFAGMVIWSFSNNFSKAVPENFTYSTDIISYDNFYNEGKNEFSGQILSASSFSYQVIEKKDNVLIIKNRFDVKKPSGKEIFSVERLYGIDSKTGRHVPGFGDKDREGYLFAPQNLNKQDFIYWHINYDTPAKMQFIEEETIEGLKVYKYECKYKADQTKNLKYLPDVPEKRGVEADVLLNLWLEPVSGKLIKYEDSTTAWYYNIHTKKRIHPWNKFHNEYDPGSISNHVDIAKIELERVKWQKYYIPLILLFLSLTVLGLGYRSETRVEIIPYVIMALICLLGISSSILFSGFLEKSENMKQKMLFSDDCQAFRGSLREEIDKNIETLHAFKSDYISDRHLPEKQFKRRTQYYLQRKDGIIALEWIPKVLNEDRFKFENQIRKNGFEKFEITELSNDKTKVRAKTRQAYYPVEYIEPFESNQSSFGFDLGSTTLKKKALDSAEKTGEVTATEPVQLIHDIDKKQIKSFLVFIPVFKDEIEKGNSHQLLGFFSEVSRFNDLVKISIYKTI